MAQIVEQYTYTGNPKFKGRPSRRVRKLVRAVAKNPEATNSELALLTGYACAGSVQSAKKSAGYLYLIADEMAKYADLQPEPLLKKLAEGLEATTKRYIPVSGVIHERENADFAERRQYLELAFKLRGDLQGKPKENETMAATGTAMVRSIMEGLERAAAKGIIPPCPASIPAEIVPLSSKEILGDLV